MVLAQSRPRDGVEGAPGMSERDSRRDQMRQEASDSFAGVDDALTAILEKAGKNQRPESSEVEQARQLLEDNKRYALVYDDAQKAKYMLLQAWTGFYQENIELALNWSVRASKTDAANGDAWISQALFSLLNGRPPLEPRIQKPRSQRRDNFGSDRRSRRPERRGRPEMTAPEGVSAGQPYGQKGVLQFEMLALRRDMLKERFQQCEFQTVDSSTIEYEFGQDTLCILFWQSDGVASDANDLPADNQPKEQERDFGTMGMGGSQQGPKEFTLEDQQKYMMQMAEACEDNTHIKFIQMNTDRYDVAKKAAGQLDPSMEAIPLVIAAESGSGAGKYVGLKAKKPFMMIVDKQGLVKYAGPAVDFMPAFILTATTGVEIDLKEPAPSQPTAPGQMGTPLMEDTMKSAPGTIKRLDFGQPMVNPVKPAADPNNPAADPNDIVSDPNEMTPVRTNKKIKKPENFQDSAKPAALLKGLTWIKGNPVRFQTGKIYVVEFWATWCPPCKKSIPHLTEIQRRFKDQGVTVIGISSEKEINKVKKFVSEQDDKMDYTVAVDKSGSASRAYMQAYRQNGIPCAFIVDAQGLVVWYGHPMNGLDAALEYLVANTAETEDFVETGKPNMPALTEEPAKTQKKQEPAEMQELSLEDQIRAEKLLQSAKLHIEESRKLRMKNPKQGIEDARKVLKEFPNTEYAQQARQLLRRVPYRWKERHHITDEEQGL